MKLIYKFLPFLLPFLMFSCKWWENKNNTSPKDTTTATTSVNYENLAKDLCACSPTLLVLNEKIFELQAQNNIDEITNLLPEIERLNKEELEPCLKKLEEKYGKDSQKLPQTLQQLKSICPNLAKMMEMQAQIDEKN